MASNSRPLLSAFGWIAERRGRENSARISHQVPVVVTTIFVALYIPFAVKTFGFADWLDKYEAAKARTEWAPIEQVPVSENIHPFEYEWIWTHPAMSALLRGDVSAGIDNAIDLETFEPELLRSRVENPPSKNPLERYIKRSNMF